MSLILLFVFLYLYYCYFCYVTLLLQGGMSVLQLHNGSPIKALKAVFPNIAAVRDMEAMRNAQQLCQRTVEMLFDPTKYKIVSHTEPLLLINSTLHKKTTQLYYRSAANYWHPRRILTTFFNYKVLSILHII